MSVKVTKDGRTIRTDVDYTAFRREVYKFQLGRCGNPGCEIRVGRPTRLDAELISDYSFHLNHLHGRGGGKRDDVMFRDGEQIVRGDCGKCHKIGRAHV